MGGNYSSLPVAPTDFQYFLMYFWHSDTIKLALANEFVIDVIRQAISQCWHIGIQNEQLCEDNSYEIILYGKPFKSGGSRDEAIQTRRFCCKMLADLRKFGWTLVTTSDLSRTDDRSALFFHRNSLENRESPVVCVSLSWTDSLQLINAPTELKAIFKDTVHRSYWLGVQEEHDYGLDFEIKLQQNPWNTSIFETSVCGRKLLLDIVRRFERRGFLFYGTTNVKETADSLFFIYDDQYPAGRGDYIMVSLDQTDKLRLFSCPQNLIDATRSEIEQYWRKGLRNETNSGVVFEFQMGGYPWNAEGKDNVGSRFFILMLLQKYLSMGWCLITCMDITRKQNDKSVFIFKSCRPVSLAHFCISLNETDKFRLLNAPKEIVDLTRRAISQGWPQGIKDENEYYGSHQFVLRGYPFGESLGNEFLLARCMMLLVLKALTESGWRIICSADISSKVHCGSEGDFSEDVHSWYFVYTGNTAESSIINSHETSSAMTVPSAPPVEGDSDDLPSYSEAAQQANATEIDNRDLPTYSEANTEYFKSI